MEINIKPNQTKPHHGSSSDLHISGLCHQPRTHLEPSSSSLSANTEAPRLLGTSRGDPWGADSALCLRRGREIGFQGTEDSKSASRSLETQRTAVKDGNRPRAKVGPMKRKEGGRERGREEEELIYRPRLHGGHCACQAIHSNNDRLSR